MTAVSSRDYTATTAEKIPTTTPQHSWPALLLHSIAFVSLSNSFRLLWEPSPFTDYINSQRGGHWQFLTVLGLGVSWLYFLVALFKDAAPSIKVFDLAKTTLAIIVVPAEGLISILYWSMQAYDPALLTPANAAFKLRLSLDLSIHVLPALFLWLDFLTFSPRMSDRAHPMLIASCTTMAYTLWMEYLAKLNKAFPYPFLNDMSQSNRAAFYVFVVPILLGLYKAANAVHVVVRGKNSGVQANAAKKLS